MSDVYNTAATRLANPTDPPAPRWIVELFMDAQAEAERLREALEQIDGYCSIIDTFKGQTAIAGLTRDALALPRKQAGEDS